MRLSLGKCLAALVLAPAVWAAATPARAETLPEYRLKAAFLYNFLSFTEWPAEAGPGLELCVYGPDPFGENLDKLSGRNVGARVLSARRVPSMDGLASCQAIFITRPVIGNLDRVLSGLGERPVLTIADSPGASREGVAINMDTAQDRVTFEANLTAARKQGLSLSAKLLRLATEVRD